MHRRKTVSRTSGSKVESTVALGLGYPEVNRTAAVALCYCSNVCWQFCVQRLWAFLVSESILMILSCLPASYLFRETTHTVLMATFQENLAYAQNPLRKFFRNFPVDGKLPACCELVSDTANKSATSRCNGIWETTRHKFTQRTFACINLLRTCYGETGVMDYGL